MNILLLLLMGLVVGAIARLVVPGRQPFGFFGTMAVGVAGALLGWWIGGEMLGGARAAQHPWIWAIIGSILLTLVFSFILNALTRRSGYPTRTGRRW